MCRTAGPRDDHSEPRSSAADPWESIALGIRWADTTSTSNGTWNSARAVAAADMTGQSESEPITMPTIGSAIDDPHEEISGVAGTFEQRVHILADRRHMSHLSCPGTSLP